MNSTLKRRLASNQQFMMIGPDKAQAFCEVGLFDRMITDQLKRAIDTEYAMYMTGFKKYANNPTNLSHIQIPSSINMLIQEICDNPCTYRSFAFTFDAKCPESIWDKKIHDGHVVFYDLRFYDDASDEYKHVEMQVATGECDRLYDISVADVIYACYTQKTYRPIMQVYEKTSEYVTVPYSRFVTKLKLDPELMDLVTRDEVPDEDDA